MRPMSNSTLSNVLTRRSKCSVFRFGPGRTRDTLKYHSTPFESEDLPRHSRKRVGWVSTGSGFVDTRIYDGTKVRPGNLITGPAVIEEPERR